VRFSEIIGQDRVAGRIENALRADRLAHALMFVGPTGVGRRTTALALAGRLLCPTPIGPDGCGDCPDCRLVRSGGHPDLIEVWPTVKLASPGDDSRVFTLRDRQGVNHHLVDVRDGKLAREFPGVRQIRQVQIQELIRRLGFRPMRGQRRLVIINQAEWLGVEAANAFLKTLEEPPAGTNFVLTVPDSGRVPETIRSRCQVVAFALVPDQIVAEQVAARLGLGPDEADLVARLAGGSLGRALEVDREQMAEMNQTVDQALSRPRQARLELSPKLASDRETARLFLNALAERHRDLARVRKGRQRIEAVAGFQAVVAARRDLERQANIQLVLDGLLVQMERPRS
jgi:DNA polymerase-3 subunit delta'